MKKIIFTLALSLSILSASAFRGMSELNLSVYDNSVFNVVLDNVPYNYNTASYRLENVAPGNHYLSVICNQISGSTIVPVKLFSGYVNIPANMKIFSMISMSGSFVILSQTAMLGPDDAYANNVSYYDAGYNSWGNYGGYSGYSGYSGYGNVYFDYSPGMSQSSFLSLISMVNNATFESSKITIASQAINTNLMTSSQLLMLLNCFTFESSKLEIAKLAYANIIDKENFFKVNSAFTFDSSIDELNEFIAGS